MRANAINFNNVYYAQRGYAVMNYSERGWGNSCGFKKSRTKPACNEGWWHFADQRFEVRDAQYLLGLLADERIAKPERHRRGGRLLGQRPVDAAGLPARPGAADQRQARALEVAGRPRAQDQRRRAALDLGRPGLRPPVQRPLQGHRLARPGPPPTRSACSARAYADLFLIAGSTKGYIAPKGADPTADPKEIFAASNAGEPYGKNLEQPLNQMRRFSGITRLQPKAAPLLMMSGWNDDLFPPEQTARSYRILRKAHGDSYVHLQWGDVGHPRAQNKHNTYVLFNKEVHNFFDHFLKGEGKRGLPRNGGITAMTTTCPEKAPGQRPLPGQRSGQALARQPSSSAAPRPRS